MKKITRYSLLLSLIIVVVTLSISKTVKQNVSKSTKPQVNIMSEKITSQYNLSDKNIFDLKYNNKQDSLINSDIFKSLKNSSILKLQLNMRGILCVLNSQQEEFLQKSAYLGLLAPTYLTNKAVYLNTKSSFFTIFSEQLAIRFFGEDLAYYNGFYSTEHFEIRQNEELLKYSKQTRIALMSDVQGLNTKLKKKNKHMFATFLSYILAC